ncbi:MAG TPA: PASTA domain-containing protein [Microbacterium sp.]|uniref:protein kinase domain-containing protein n=1 Tax=Microbacterium sp. TaxID=51671 RepID=UPI002D0C4373|nr:PASTA domain-containing protein [Microbacterium sp.]HWI30761.1 PASTA domain-containing protein [Microbacterium sp.]
MIDSTSLVSGRFRLGELLGTGGSASVFAAVDTRTGSSIALKILHPHLSERPAARGAFLAEARRAEPLRHPNIVGVLDVGIDDAADAPLAWIALERAAGSSLSEHVARHGPLWPAEAVAVLDGTLRALEAAHAIGLVHRDVSPANIMVAPGGIDSAGVRLLDFGLADAAGKAALGTDDLLSVEATGRAGVMGNVNYVSPEQVRGEPVDARGDVYQAGAVLHFALTGRPPFPRESTGQTMRAHLETPPPVPSVTDPRIPRSLDRIVVRAMLKDPADRFASAAAMRAALTGLGIGAAGAVPEVRAAPVVRTAVTSVTDAVRLPVEELQDEGHEDEGLEDEGLEVGGLSAERLPAETYGITRVLGRTMVPPRVPGSPDSTIAHAPRGRARHARSRAGTWFAATTAAIVTVIVVALAATSTPTASVEAEPSAAPSPTPTAPPPAPEPEPSVKPIVSLVTVPDLTRMSVAEAAGVLADAGLVAGAVTLVDSPSLRDTVLESNPASGQRLGRGGAVALTAASGLSTIPDVAGQDRDAALAAVQSAGFAPSLAHRPATAQTPAGRIVGTEPGAGTRLVVGTPISVLESVGSVAPEPTATATPTSRPTPTSTPTSDPGE